MKSLYLLIFSILLLSSCKKNEEQLFEMAYEFDVIFEAGLTQFQVHFIDTYALDTRLNELLAASGRSRSEISSIVPKSAEMINLQTSVALDFIQDISFRVFDGSQFTPEEMLNIQEVFFRDNLPQDQRTFIDLLPALPDVKDYLLEDKFNIGIRVQLRAPPPSTVDARVRIKFAAQ